MNYFRSHTYRSRQTQPERNTQCDSSVFGRAVSQRQLPTLPGQCFGDGSIETIPVGDREMTEFSDSELIVGYVSVCPAPRDARLGKRAERAFFVKVDYCRGIPYNMPV